MWRLKKYLFKNGQPWSRFLIAGAFIVGLACCLCLLPARPAFAEIGEYTLKAVYLWRIPGFIGWPPDAETRDASKPFVISVIGGDPFGGKLEALASKRTILGKKVTIRHISQTDEIKNSHVLFIGKMKDKEIAAVLSFTRDRPILTVNDRKDGAEQGAIINFRVNKNKLGFEINENAAHRAGLVISSRMLRIATRIVDPLKKRN